MMPPLIDGDAVTLSKLAWWPPCCVKCGTTEGLGPRVQKYAWVPPWTYLLIPLGLLPAALVQMMLTKRAALTHGICAPCNARWKIARVGGVASLLVPLLGGFLGLLAGAAASSGVAMAAAGLLLFPGIVVFPTLAHFLLVRRRTLRAVFIDDHVIKVAGVSASALEMLRAAALVAAATAGVNALRHGPS
jgi:hypothetical protein